MQKFQEISTLDLNKERKDVQEFSNAANSPSHDFSAPSRAEEEALSRHQEQKQMQLEQDEVDFNEQIIRERNREIREIETAVVEVGQIFQDLAAMVNEQGIMVDNIEANISSAVEQTGEGVKDLEGAEEYQIKSRKKCVVISIIVFVVIVVVVLIILFALRII